MNMYDYMRSTENEAMGVICIHALYNVFMNIYAWLYTSDRE